MSRAELGQPRTWGDRLAVPIVFVVLAGSGLAWWFWPSHSPDYQPKSVHGKLLMYAGAPPSTDEFRRLIKDVPTDDLEKMRLLGNALAANNRETMKALIDKGVSPDGPLRDGEYLFERTSNVRAAQTLLNFGASLHPNWRQPYPPSGWSLQQNPQVVRFLIDKGADPDLFHGALLQEAVMHRNVESVRYLLSKGARPSAAKVQFYDKPRAKPREISLAEYARKQGLNEIAEILEKPANSMRRPCSKTGEWRRGTASRR